MLIGVLMVIFYAPPRGDELISFLITRNVSLADLLRNLYEGTDISYLHSVLLWGSFKLFPETLYLQRLLSLVIFLPGIWFLWRSLRLLFSRLNSLTALSLVVIANIGYFLAYDGRFYSLVFTFSTLLYYYLIICLNENKKFGIIILAGICILGYCTSPIFLLAPMVATVGLFGLWYNNKTRDNLESLLRLLIVTTITFLVYWVFLESSFFRNAQTGYLLSLQPVTEHTSLLKAAVANVARWVALPYYYPVWGWTIAISMISFLWIAITYFRFKIPSDKMVTKAEKFMIWCVLITIFLILLQGAWAILISGTVWPFRYYTPIYFLLAFGIAYILNFIEINKKKVVIVIISAGLLISSFGYMIQYREWKSKEPLSTMMPKGGRILFEENNPSSGVFAAFGSMYYDTNLRNNLYFTTNSTDVKRIRHMEELSERYPEFHFYGIKPINEISKIDYLITDKEIINQKPLFKFDNLFIYKQ